LPQWIRLPTLFHRLAPRGGRWLDRGRYRALFTPGRSWPRAARRLLQSKAICKHDLRISKPGLARAARLWRVRLAIHEPASAGPPATDGARLAPRCHRSRSPVAARRTADADRFSRGCRWFDPKTAPTNGSRGFTGQGPFDARRSGDRRADHPPRQSLVLEASPQPDWLGHLMSLPLAPTTMRDRDRTSTNHSRGPSRVERAYERSPDESGEARPRVRTLARSPGPGRAASRTPSRKGDAFRCTRGAFRRRTSLAGSALFHSLSPTCGWRTRASSIFAPDRARTCGGGDEDSATL